MHPPELRGGRTTRKLDSEPIIIVYGDEPTVIEDIMTRQIYLKQMLSTVK